MQILSGHTNRVNDIAFSPDARCLASCSTDGTVRLWDCWTGEGDILQQLQPNPVDEVGDVAFAGCTALIVRLRGQPVRAWDLNQRTCIATLTDGIYLWSGGIAVSPAGDLVAAHEWMKDLGAWAVRIWKTATWEQAVLYPLPYPLRPTGLAFDPTGTHLLTAAGRLDARTGVILSKTQFRCETIAWSPEGNLVAGTGYRSMSVVVSDARTGEQVRSLKLDRKGVKDFAFSPAGNYLAVVNYEDVVRVWDTRTWEERSALAWRIGKLKCLAFSPDGTRAACGSHNGTILIWDWDWE
jgi:WD40 repeat protein